MNQIVADARADPVALLVDSLRFGPSPRHRIDPRQVAALTELCGDWDPIVVQETTMTVIDGRHRLTAARRLGHTVIRARLFRGSEADARVEAVRLNVRHGLPLSLTERTVAARDLLALLPCLSDRQLGDVCGLSPRTIARIRQDLARQYPRDGTTDGPAPAARDDVSDKRIGRDGRLYPRDPAALRWEIRRLLEQDNTASLRAVAAKAGASPETVRSVRRELGPGSVGKPEAGEGPIQPATDGSNWSEDSACASTPEGRAFAQWFDEHQLDDELMSSMAGAVPLNRLYNAIDEAYRRKRLWDTFAKTLQDRVRPGNAANP